MGTFFTILVFYFLIGFVVALTVAKLDKDTDKPSNWSGDDWQNFSGIVVFWPVAFLIVAIENAAKILQALVIKILG